MRRSTILTLALACAALACRQSSAPDAPLRLGYYPNITHGQALVGVADGTFARELGRPLQVRLFNAGPAEMEALFAGDIDVCYVGNGPVSLAYIRSGNKALKVLAGATSGGAVLVTRTATRPEDLRGKRISSPQLGNTQDVSLRWWLRQHGLKIGPEPNAVNVTPLENPDIVAMFDRKEIEGAWVPEPWGARLLKQGAHIVVDERDLWEGRTFPVAVIVASARAIETRRADLVALLRAHLALTDRWRSDRNAFANAANEAYGKVTGHPLDPDVLRDAFSRLDPTDDPMPQKLAIAAERVAALGLAPKGDLSGIVDSSILQEARASAAR